MGSIGDRLQEERKRLGYNQTAFAEIGGVHRTAQSAYERNERHPDTAYLQAIVALGVDIQYVIVGIRSLPSVALSPEEAVLVDNYRNANEAGRESLDNVSRALASSKEKEKEKSKRG